jgi:hypothetical protein
MQVARKWWQAFKTGDNATVAGEGRRLIKGKTE